jgi:WD40-like Beta Propeller Repeat
MYASAGSVCQVAPVVPIRTVPGGGVSGVEADVQDVPSVTIVAIAIAASTEIRFGLRNALLLGWHDGVTCHYGLSIAAGRRPNRWPSGPTAGSGPGVPSWSPDGTKLAYFYTPGAPGGFTAEVWTMNTDGSEKQRLYHSACCVMSWAPPIWSPDGKKIAFAATSADGTFVIASDGNDLRRLSTASANRITWQRLP